MAKPNKTPRKLSDIQIKRPELIKDAHIVNKNQQTPTKKVANLRSIVTKLLTSYDEKTPTSLKMLDSYMVFIMATGIIQFLYMIIVGNFPYNAFLSGFIGSVGSFILAANLRLQSDPKNEDFKHVSSERAFADFVFGSIVFYGVVLTFIG